MQITHCQYYNESAHRKEQLASGINTIPHICDTVKNVNFIHVYFCEATDSKQYRPPNAYIYQEVSNTNHFGSVSESLGGLAAMSQCMSSRLKCKHSHLFQ